MQMKKHGGARNGAGRPKGQSKYQEPTKPMRIPFIMIKQVENLINNKSKYRLYNQAVQTGSLMTTFNLHEIIVKNPRDTFFLRATGDSMQNAGIMPGDILVVDRSLQPKPNKMLKGLKF